MKPLPIVHLNGFPGTGKLRIAGELAARLNTYFDSLIPQSVSSVDRDLAGASIPEQHVARIVHNHLLIDPANAVLHRTQPGYQTLRKALRDAVFSSLANETSTYSAIYILTDWQSGDDIGSRVCEDVKDMAQARGSELIPVIVSCNEEENVRRLASADRLKFSKITDVSLLLQFRGQSEPPPVFKFEGHENRLEVNVTDLSAEEAAAIIFEHVEKYLPKS